MSELTARPSVRLALPLLLALVCAPQLRAQEPTPAPTEQREHVVRRGDTLWDLARTYLQNPFMWTLIYEANRAVVENPHRIFPTERLIIPPLLQQAAASPMGEPLAPAPEPAPMPAMVPRSADTAAVVVAEVDLRRSVVSYGEYQSAPWLSLNGRNEVSGRILRPADPASADDRLATRLHPRDLVLIEAPRAQPGDSLLIVRIGRRVGDAGLLMQPLGVLAVDRVDGSGVRARIVRQYGDAMVGDLVMPFPTVPDIGLGEPEPVTAGPEGVLLDFVTPESMHGTTDVGFVSLGRSAGVRIGDEFAVYVPARAQSGTPAAAPVQVATVRVVRLGDASATVRVVGVSSTTLRGGLPVRLIRRMP